LVATRRLTSSMSVSVVLLPWMMNGSFICPNYHKMGNEFSGKLAQTEWGLCRIRAAGL
jgi:hypothetical protein